MNDKVNELVEWVVETLTTRWCNTDPALCLIADRMNCEECYARRILSHPDLALIVGGISDDLAQTASDSEAYCANGVGVSWERNAHMFRAFKEAGYKQVIPLAEAIKELNNER